MILAPLRGVTIWCFRHVFAEVIGEVGFTEAITPFISAMLGIDPLKDRELLHGLNNEPVKLTPQFIGKDPSALKHCLERILAAGYDTADLNAGCPYPMVRNKGRGSGLLRTPDKLRKMLEIGCKTLGDGKFSLKTRLGVDGNDELLSLMPMINEFPLRHIAVHARNARQMYDGECDYEAFERVKAIAKMPVIANGDIDWQKGEGMVGRSFIRYLGKRDDIGELLIKYIEASRRELNGDRQVLGRIKELLAYWKDDPIWSVRWKTLKICRSVDELLAII